MSTRVDARHLPGMADLFGERETYPCTLMDPNWAERGGGKVVRGAQRHYELAGKLGDVTPIYRIIRDSGAFAPADNAHVWIWYTDNFLPDAMTLGTMLGLTYKRTYQWFKTDVDLSPDLEENERLWSAMDPAEADAHLRMGIGQYARGCHEGMLLFIRGQGQDPSVWTGDRSVRSAFHAPHPRDESGKIIHSRKPPRSYEVIERVSRGPRMELFARVARPGWNVWGAEAPTAP